MTRWWAAMPRLRREVRWDQVPRLTRETYEATIGSQAQEASAVVAPGDPEPGWMSAAHSRDGKAYPCREQTTGAEPAWLWKGEAR